MRTVEKTPAAEFSRWQKVRSDVALLLRFAAMFIGYHTTGRRIRRLYRECETQGKVLWIDADPEETRRELQ